MWKERYFFLQRHLFRNLKIPQCQKGAEILVKILCNGFCKRITIETTLEDGAVRADEHDVRNTLDAVDFCRYTSGIVDLVPDHSELSGSVDGHLRSLTLPNCNAQNIEFLAVIFVVDCFDIRHFPLARAAPRRPEVHNDIFP